MVDRALERRYAPDARGVDAGAGRQKDLHKLDAVETCRQVERNVEIAARLDQYIYTFPVDSERVPERGSEHVGLRDFAEQRPSRARLDVRQLRMQDQQAPQRARVAGMDRVKRSGHRLATLARGAPGHRFVPRAR